MVPGHRHPGAALNPFPPAPLPEEYSRVTDPERFRPLHALALERVARLVAEYDVARSEAFAPLPTLSRFESARARALRGSGPRSVRWRPWPRRPAPL